MKLFERGAVRGWLYEPDIAAGKSLVITHGAGSSANAPFLVAIAEGFAAAGFHVLRCDLPYRQARPTGPPQRGDAERDREGLRAAAGVMREIAPGTLILGGHSYGGRQSSLMAAETPAVADMLLLFSYPLHPPRQPEQLRTQHLDQLRTPALFLHGTRDPFGSIVEMEAALKLIPARHLLVPFEKTGHEWTAAAVPMILRETLCFAIA